MKRKGFTLVELLIVVVILGILAAIVVPQFSDASTDSQTSSLAENLKVMRGQIELYKLQHNGVYPAFANFATLMTTKTDSGGNAGGNLGPYIRAVPANPFLSGASATQVVKSGATVGSAGWFYDETTGLFQAFDSAAHQSGF